MVFLIQSQEFLVELLVLYRLTGFTHPSYAMGLVLIWRSRQKLISSKYSLIDMLYACGAFAAHLLEIYLFEI